MNASLLLAVVAVCASGLAWSQNLPSGFSDVMTNLEADLATMMGLIAPVVIAFCALFVGLRLLKRFGNRV